MDSIVQEKRRNLIKGAISIALTIVTGGIGIINWILLRELVLTVITHSPIDPWAWRAIDNFTFLGFGILWLTTVYLSQYFYLKGAKKGGLWYYVTLITGFQIFLFFLSHFIPIVIKATELTFASGVLVAIELLISVFLILFSRVLKHKGK